MSLPRPILVVEDDAALRATLAEQIALCGEFRAVEAGTAAEAAAELDAGDARFDAVVLDVGLPDGDGRELCAKLRRDGKRMPVIMLTGADGEQDVVRGLDAGANDAWYGDANATGVDHVDIAVDYVKAYEYSPVG